MDTTTKDKFDFSDKKILENIISSIVKVANPDKIILFGSRATGKARKDSDYDLCVLKKNIRHNRKLAFKIRSGINVLAPIDIIVATPSHFEKMKNKWYYVYYEISKLGKVVYEKG